MATLIALTIAALPTCSYAEDTPVYSKQAERIEALVNRAAALIEGRGAAVLNEFRQPDSEWWFGSTYLFVYDQELNVLLNPAFPTREGTNPSGEKDITGKAFHDEFLAVVRTQGSGWVGYQFPKPGQSGVSQKWSYVRAVNISGTPGIVGAGFYPASD